MDAASRRPERSRLVVRATTSAGRISSRVFSAMHYDNVEVVPQAVSDKRGAMMLHVPGGSGKSQKASLEPLANSDDSVTPDEREPNDAYPVDVTTLDSFFASRPQGPSFLKIDVEGHELAVLKGGVKTLQTFRPAILLECEARPSAGPRCGASIRTSRITRLRWNFLHRPRPPATS